MTAQRSPLDDVYTVSEAARALGYHPRTIQRWCDEGRIIAKRFGPPRRALWLVDMRSLHQFVAETGRISHQKSVRLLHTRA